MPTLRFCYFLEYLLSLQSYYHFSYVSLWPPGILLIIVNILIKIARQVG